jgi:serine/threonine-protein kinase
MDAAVADCRKAVDLQPANAIGWGNLADALYQRGSRDESLDAYRKALEAGNKQLAVNPANADLIAILAKCAAKAGQPDVAVELAGKALAQGDGVRVLYNAAKAYGLAGQCSRSAELLKQALDRGYPRQDAGRDPRQDAGRDPDLVRLRAAPLACAVPPL